MYTITITENGLRLVGDLESKIPGSEEKSVDFHPTLSKPPTSFTSNDLKTYEQEMFDLRVLKKTASASYLGALKIVSIALGILAFFSAEYTPAQFHDLLNLPLDRFKLELEKEDFTEAQL